MKLLTISNHVSSFSSYGECVTCKLPIFCSCSHSKNLDSRLFTFVYIKHKPEQWFRWSLLSEHPSESRHRKNLGLAEIRRALSLHAPLINEDGDIWRSCDIKYIKTWDLPPYDCNRLADWWKMCHIRSPM